MGQRGDGQEKREGYGRFPNSLVRSGAWAKFHPMMRAVYGALMGLLNRAEHYASDGVTSLASVGYPTNSQIATTAGVRVADVPKVVDRLEEIGLVIKKKATIAGKPRTKYILLPPDHPMNSRIGYSCERIYGQVGKGWGLTRQWGPRKKTHESPTRLQTHESPTRLLSTDIHRPKSSPTPSNTLRRPIPSRAAARLSHKTTTKGKVSDRLLPSLFAALPREQWDEHTAHFITNGHRLRDIEEAKRIASGVRLYLPTLKRERGKGGPAGETVGVPPGREDSSGLLREKEQRLCQGVTRTHLACVLRPMPGSRFCRCHQAQAERAQE